MKVVETYLRGVKIYVIVEIGENESANDLRKMIGVKEIR